MILAALFVKLVWIGAGASVLIAVGVFARDRFLEAMGN